MHIYSYLVHNMQSSGLECWSFILSHFVLKSVTRKFEENVEFRNECSIRACFSVFTVCRTFFLKSVTKKCDRGVFERFATNLDE